MPEKEEFYSNLNKEDITDAGYMHAKRVCKDFETKKLREYYDLYLKMICYFWVMFLKTLSNRYCQISFSSKIGMASSFNKD